MSTAGPLSPFYDGKMDKVDRLLQRVVYKPIYKQLLEDNPYTGGTLDELLDMMAPDGDAPAVGTREGDLFAAAVIEAFCREEQLQGAADV